jgi:hypothetical protein
LLHAFRPVVKEVEEKMKLIYLIIGSLMLLSAQFLPSIMAVIYYSTGTPHCSGWGSKDPANPMQIPGSTTYDQLALVVVGVQPAEVTSATVSINGVVVTLTYSATYSTELALTYLSPPWTSGSEGTSYTMVWTVQTSTVGTLTDTTYLKVAVAEGYFTINGVKADTTTKMRVSNPTLSFGFYITSSVLTTSNFAEVYVQVYKGTTYLETYRLTASPPKNYTGSYTLPSTGTYTLNGYVSYAGKAIQKMSIVAPYGEGDGGGVPFSVTSLQWMLGLTGAGLCVYGVVARNPKRRR